MLVICMKNTYNTIQTKGTVMYLFIFLKHNFLLLFYIIFSLYATTGKINLM